jgi:hypothetical protein
VDTAYTTTTLLLTVVGYRDNLPHLEPWLNRQSVTQSRGALDIIPYAALASFRSMTEAGEEAKIRGLANHKAITTWSHDLQKTASNCIIRPVESLCDDPLTWRESGENHGRKDPNLKLASLARLERATHCLEGSCSILLSYRDNSHLLGLIVAPLPRLWQAKSI